MRINNYSPVVFNPDSLVETLKEKITGFVKLSILVDGTAFSLGEGSLVDVNGDLILWEDDGSPVTISTVGINYIGVSPSTRDVVVAGTPAYDSEKRGYYDSSGNRIVSVVYYNGTKLNTFRLKI